MPTLIAHQAVTHPDTIVGPSVQCSRFNEVVISAYHGFNEAVPNTNSGSFLLQTSITVSGNEDWVTEKIIVTASGTPSDEVFTATEPADEATIAVASTSGFGPKDYVYVRDAVVTDSEWVRVREIVTDTSIVLIDGLTREHALTTTAIFGNAEKFVERMTTSASQRVRMVYVHEGSIGANTHIKAEVEFSTLDFSRLHAGTLTN